MSNRARLYPLLTLCTLGCSLPAEPGDATATTDDSTSEASSGTFGEESSLTESILTTATAEEESATGDEAEIPLAAPYLYVDYSPIKRYEFSWKPVAGAEYYQLLERPYPDVPGWSQLGADLVGTSTTWSTPIHLRSSAAYMLRACNQAGCRESEPVQVDSGADGAIGYFKAANAESGDYFGHSVAISGDGATMVVGAFLEDSGAHGVNGDDLHNYAPDSGAAYVFVREGDTWKQQAYLKSFNVDAEDGFGVVTISSDGNTIAVGAPQEDSAATGIGGDRSDDSAENSGAVYVFERKSGAWSQTAYIKASNTHSTAEFGQALALSADGNTLAVGAPYEDSAATGVDGDPWPGVVEDSGAAYVYSRVGGEWVHRAYLKASNAGENDQFGAAVALSGDGTTLAVGAPYERSKSAGIDGDQLDDSSVSGAVYLFTLNDGAWSQQAYVKASNPGLQDGFGTIVDLALDGDTLAVAAHRESSAANGVGGDQWNNDAEAAGAVYVFSRLGQAWQQDAYIKSPSPSPGDQFGRALALSGDGSILVAGAPSEDSAAAGSFGEGFDEDRPDSGAAYVFTRVAGTWTHRRYLKAPNSHSECLFGGTMDITADGGTLVIGAPFERNTATGIGGDQHAKAGLHVGSVYMY